MKWIIAVAVVAVTLVTATFGQTSGGNETTVRDGVYSADQAKRGRAVYVDKCATCHDGGTMGPELWGDAFLAQRTNKNVRAFYDRIQDTMPEDNPGSLSETELVDIIAFVIQQNGFPAGEKPIHNADALNSMKFVEKK
jgi:quinoprotein glucose dehydrogenase